MRLLSLVSLAILAVLVAAVYLLSSFAHKFEDWQQVKKNEPVIEKTVTVEIDKSGVQ